jgi:hypothetical protein
MWDDLDLLPAWIVEELRRPLAPAPDGRRRIMETVRAWGAPSRRPAGGHRGVWARFRRGLGAPLAGLGIAAAVAAGLLIELVQSHPLPDPAVSAAAAAVIGDSIDPILDDTLRLVRFVLRAPGASHVALAGDFNAWDPTTTPLTGHRGGVWSTVVPLRPGRYGYAFVVDDTHWVAGPPADPGRQLGVPPHGVVIVGSDTI